MTMTDNNEREVQVFEVYVDGILWEDADGNTQFGHFELSALVESIAAKGYDEIETVAL